jgi:hypothetical protein
MPYVRDSFWRGRQFASVEQMQAADNTFITIEPAVDEPTWYASVSLLDEGHLRGRTPRLPGANAT